MSEKTKWPTTKAVGIACGVCGKIGTCIVSPDGTAFKCWKDDGRVHQIGGHGSNGNGRTTGHGAPGTNGHTPRRIIHTYDYRDEYGTMLYQVCRYEPKDFRQRRPDGRGGYIWNLDGVRRVLYRLPDIMTEALERPEDWVFIPEGEKDVDRLRDAGLIATCNVGGAGKWRDEYSVYLRGRRVALLPDNDEPGEKHIQQVARSLADHTDEIRIVHLPGLPPKGDVSDFLSARSEGSK